MWSAVLEKNAQKCQDIFLNIFLGDDFLTQNRRFAHFSPLFLLLPATSGPSRKGPWSYSKTAISECFSREKLGSWQHYKDHRAPLKAGNLRI